MKPLFILSCFILLYLESVSQGCFPDDDDPTITLNCTQNCTDLTFTIPDLKQTTQYTILDIPYTPYPFTDSRTPALTFSGAWPGNSYSALQDLPFGFCFFGNVYNRLAVGSNGTVTFDASMANGYCDPFLIRGNARFPLPNARYPTTLIAGVMHDLDPGDTARASANRKIEFRIDGSAPCRKAIISFFEVPLWPGPQRNCQLQLQTHQIVLYEGTGIIDIYVKDSPACMGSNAGNNTLGIQDLTANIAYCPRNKNCQQWGSNNMNLGYRFLPTGGNSLLASTNLILNRRPLGPGVVTPSATPYYLDVTFTNICPSVAHSVAVLQATYNDCAGSGSNAELYDTIYIDKTNSLTATVSASAAQCTSPTGSITVDVPAGMGIPPLQYSLNGGPYQASNRFLNLAAGLYTVIVIDGSNCSDTMDIEVESQTTLNVTVDAVSTSCNRSSDGMIRVDPGGGVPPITYSLNGGPPQASSTFTGLAPGFYNVSVTDGAGCVSSNHRVFVQAGPPLSTTYTKSDISCFGGADGSITVDQPTAGSAPYSYSINSGPFTTTNTFTGLVAGNYVIDFRDASGCTGSLNVSIVMPGALSATAAATPVRCFGENTGTINVQPNGGTFPYTFSLNGGPYQAAASFNAAAGTYYVDVLDRNGCPTRVNNIVVTEPPVLTVSAVSTNATCDGGNDGTITMTSGGGTPGYEYSVDNTNYQSSNVFNLAPGTYPVDIRDANGCAAAAPDIIVGLTNNLTLARAGDEITCEGNSVSLQAVSNATQYAWRPATGLSDAAISNPVASPAVTTEYIVTATLGRCSAEDTMLVTIRPAPIANAGPDGFICVGQTYRLQGSGGVTYEWTPATFLSDPAVSNPLVTPDRTIDYTLNVTDANGCRSLTPGQVTVDVTPPFRVVVSPADTIVAQGDQFQLTAVAEVANTNFTWTPSTGLDNPSIANPTVTAGAVGDIMQFTVTASTVGGCIGTTTARVRVYKGPELYVPTAFSPNNDGKNDRFYPYGVGIKELKYFRVYNRWGQMIFSTSRLNHGWDGKFGGIEEASGIYVWVAEGLGKDNKPITKRGTVMLVR